MTDRYYIEPSRAGWDIMDAGTPLRDTDLVNRLNEQDEDLNQAHAILLAARELSAFLAARPRCVACGGAGEHGWGCPVEKLRKAIGREG